MEIHNISEIAKAGMNYERTRLEYASLRLAQANVVYSSPTEALQAAKTLNMKSAFSDLGEVHDQHHAKSSVKVVSDPGHPLADSSGQVYFVKVDPVTEMAVLISALRSYQANVRAFNTNSEFNQAALEIGGSK